MITKSASFLSDCTLRTNSLASPSKINSSVNSVSKTTIVLLLRMMGSLQDLIQKEIS